MTIEVAAKKVEDAIKQGLEQLGASLDEVNVEVLEQGGLFRKAKVRLTLERDQAPEKPEPAPQKPKPAPQKKAEEPADEPAPKKKDAGTAVPNANIEPPKQKPAKPAEQKPRKQNAAPKPENKPAQEHAEIASDTDSPDGAESAERHAKNSEEVKQAIAHATEFISQLIKKMGFEDATVQSAENGDVEITAPAGDDSLIIGRHGETLSAISFLAETLGRAEKQHVNIVADCNGYRGRRAASLTAMAKRRANEAVNKHRKIKLEPMDRIDRRTVHNALGDDDRVSTVSEGKEPHRYIVILPKQSH